MHILFFAPGIYNTTFKFNRALLTAHPVHNFIGLHCKSSSTQWKGSDVVSEDLFYVIVVCDVKRGRHVRVFRFFNEVKNACVWIESRPSFTFYLGHGTGSSQVKRASRPLSRVFGIYL